MALPLTNPYTIIDRIKSHLQSSSTDSPYLFLASLESKKSPYKTNKDFVGQISDTASKDIEQQLIETKKENMHLKFRNHYLQEIMGTQFKFNESELLKENINIMTENKKLCSDVLYNRQLLGQALEALESMENEMKGEFVQKNTKIFELNEMYLTAEREKDVLLKKYAEKYEQDVNCLNVVIELKGKINDLEEQLKIEKETVSKLKNVTDTASICKTKTDQLEEALMNKEVLIYQLEAKNKELEEREGELNAYVDMLNKELGDKKCDLAESVAKIRRLKKEPEYLKKLLSQCEYMHELEQRKTEKLSLALLAKKVIIEKKDKCCD